MLNGNQIRFCAEQCEKQQSGEMSVYRMCLALEFAIIARQVSRGNISEEVILFLGKIIEPDKNHGGFRKTPVSFKGGKVLHNHGTIPREIENWITSCNEAYCTFDESYQRLEEIHPFLDGNGRLGAIVYNYLNDSLDNPVNPPEFEVDS